MALSLPVFAVPGHARKQTNTASLKGMAALRGESIIEVLELDDPRLFAAEA